MVNYRQGMTAAELRAEIDAAKGVAMARFELDWGTRDVRRGAHARRRTIPGRASRALGGAAARAMVQDG